MRKKGDLTGRAVVPVEQDVPSTEQPVSHLSSRPPTATARISPCVRRGQQWLSEDDLRAHLAAVLRLENVGVLLGAGASMGPLGGRSMPALWTWFEQNYSESLAWLQAENFVTTGVSVNPEALADTLEIARLEWTRARDRRLGELDAVRADLQRAVIQAALLQAEWWEHPERIDKEPSKLLAHRQLIQKLTTARQPGQAAPWVFTTNYDLAPEWAAESLRLKLINGFDGLHRRVFSPHNFDLGWRNVLARGEARFGTYHCYLAKLHGSLTWHEDGEQVLESPTSARWPKLSEFLTEGPALDGLLILPSVTKYDRTIGFVLGELFRRFAEFLGKPQTCLITNGYSFADEHVNRLLQSALQNPTLQLVVYLPEVDRKDSALDLSNCAPWAQRILALDLPQVTIVGGGPRAYFTSLATDLPDPAIYDDQAARVREMIRDLQRGTAKEGNRP